jgi:peptide/nickel transport system permease protein
MARRAAGVEGLGMRFLVFVLRRLAATALTLVAVSMLSFSLLSLAPGDFFDDMRLSPQMTEQMAASLKAQYGLDRGFVERYSAWCRSAWKGDFGVSMAYGMPAAEVLKPRLKNTLGLGGLSIVAAWLIAIPFGFVAAVRRGSWVDRCVQILTATTLAFPEILFGTLLLIAAARFGWLNSDVVFLQDASALELLKRMVLPGTVLAFAAFPVIVRHLRSALIEAARSPFVREARSAGIRGRRLWLGQILPAAANPIITLMGLSAAGLIGGSVIAETLFSWPGAGPLFIEAITARDAHIVLDLALASAALLAAANFLSEICLYIADPRLRAEGGPRR